MLENCVVLLCFLNNCKWDEQIGEYSKISDVRDSFYVVDVVIERFRNIKGSQ